MLLKNVVRENWSVSENAIVVVHKTLGRLLVPRDSQLENYFKALVVPR